jgi:hypothetical protein
MLSLHEGARTFGVGVFEGAWRRGERDGYRYVDVDGHNAAGQCRRWRWRARGRNGGRPDARTWWDSLRTPNVLVLEGVAVWGFLNPMGRAPSITRSPETASITHPNSQVDLHSPPRPK